ncbi:hypothetical protein [Streptomyces sp. NBC_00356]|uniref:hypothetical protein n=1 Tax=Streptomyces sp. NBC_00356 TaxID=2975724 RepID=UPI002E270D62
MSTFADLSRPLTLLRQLAAEHPDLPAPHIDVSSIFPKQVEFSFHNSLSDFEAWRAALHIDPQCIEHHLQGGDTTICLKVSAEFGDARIRLVGYGQNLALLRPVAA